MSAVLPTFFGTDYLALVWGMTCSSEAKVGEGEGLCWLVCGFGEARTPSSHQQGGNTPRLIGAGPGVEQKHKRRAFSCCPLRTDNSNPSTRWHHRNLLVYMPPPHNSAPPPKKEGGNCLFTRACEQLASEQPTNEPITSANQPIPSHEPTNHISQQTNQSVSYTHLTLPTIYSV